MLRTWLEVVKLLCRPAAKHVIPSHKLYSRVVDSQSLQQLSDMPCKQNSLAGLLREEPTALAAAEIEDLVYAYMEVNHILLADGVDDLLHHLDDKAY